MLIGLRLLYYLGARTIYLVGVDFGMDSTKALTDNYAFGEERDEDACSSNNAQYSVINQLLCRMATAGVFQRFGLDIYNTNPYSALRAFAHVPFDEAVKDAKKHLPEEPFDLRRWYWKPKKKKKR